MAISNELSSEIAAAILANQNSPQDLLLKQILFEIHSALQKMSESSHNSRLRELAIGTSKFPDPREH